jgi:hypothetical protein
LRKILEKNLNNTYESIEKIDERNLILSYAKLIPKHSGFLGSNYTHILQNNPKIWAELLLDNFANTSLLTAGAKFIPNYTEEYLVKIFQKINQFYTKPSKEEQEDINFFNKKIIKNPHLSITLMRKLLKLQTENKIKLTSDIEKLLQKRVKFDSSATIHKIKTQRDTILEIELLLKMRYDPVEGLIELDDVIAGEVLENYEKLNQKNYVSSYIESLKHDQIWKLVKNLEKENQYHKIEYLARERKGIVKLVSNQRKLAQTGCSLGWACLKESKEIQPDIRKYVVVNYSNVAELIADLTYSGLIVEIVDTKCLEFSEYVYKMLPEWGGSLNDLLKVSKILSKE